MRPPLHVGCKVDDCEGKHLARGYCNRHYKSLIVYGGRGHSGWRPFNAEDRIEDCRWMAEHGETLTGAAKRIGISRAALESWLRKHDPETLASLSSHELLPVDCSQAQFHGAGIRVSR